MDTYDYPDFDSLSTNIFEWTWDGDYYYDEYLGIYRKEVLWGDLFTQDLHIIGEDYIFVILPYSTYRNFYIYDKAGNLVYEQYVTSDYILTQNYDPATGAVWLGYYDVPIGAVAIPSMSGVGYKVTSVPYSSTAIDIAYPAPYMDRDFPFPPLNVNLTASLIESAFDKVKGKNATDTSLSELDAALNSLAGSSSHAGDYTGILTGISGILNNIWSFLQGVLNSIAGVLQNIWSFLQDVLGSIAGVLQNIWSFLQDVFSPPSVPLDLSPLEGIVVEDKFPFSLPWDLVNSINCLVASPQVPRWEVPIKDEVIVIDFSQFEPLAKIVRFFVTITFVVSLIILTRRLLP
jgi:hypothetical protein